MSSPFLLVAGLALFGFACRTFEHIVIRKLGLLAFLGASYTLLYALSGNVFVGLLGIVLWFCLPWIELLVRVRGMDLPIERSLRRRIPPKEDFPFLELATHEIEELEDGDYQLIDDWGYEWQGSAHFFRVFHDADHKTQAVICLTREQHMHHAYVKLVSRTEDGHVYTTWNYPFSASLKLSPLHIVNWDRSAHSFESLYYSHQELLELHGLGPDTLTTQGPDDFASLLQEDQKQMVSHNLSLGLLKASGKGMCRYTWRGLVFLWTELVKDMVRLH